VIHDMLDALSDDELRSAIEHAQGLLKQRDDARKAKALNDARALLASVGLSLKDIRERVKSKSTKAAAYHSGHRYQHPANKSLMWNAKGQKPNWLRTLENEGGKAIEIAS
jgi:DNA-binding protein H-NS